MRPYSWHHDHQSVHVHGHGHDHDHDDDDDDHARCFLLHLTSSECGLGWSLPQLSFQSWVRRIQIEKSYQLTQLLHPPEEKNKHFRSYVQMVIFSYQLS